jgi:molecular chaperone DnaK
MSWVLAVDFGTTNTVAAFGDATGVRVLTVNGSPVQASAVFLDDNNNWMVGDIAIRFAGRRLDRYEPCPKRAIPDGNLFLGGVDVPVSSAITAVFRPIVREALKQHGDQPPDLFVVTHPATWTAYRVNVLLSAAADATEGGAPWPRPLPLSEPVAAAQRVLHIAGVPATARLVVLDLGGGTTDVTVVDRHGDQLTIVGRPLGRDGLGGVDFDLRLARWMTEEVNLPGLYDRLAGAEDPDLRERAVEIREHARVVKEQLSQQSVVPALLPKAPPELPVNTPVQVSRPRLEELIRGNRDEPGLEQAVSLVNEALREAPPGPELVGVFLVGGSSRIPLLGQLVTQRVEVLPITHGDPTTAVAEGAASYALGLRSGEQDRVEPTTGPIPVQRPEPAPVSTPAPAAAATSTTRPRTKVALLLALLLVLGGGVVTYLLVNDSSSGSDSGGSIPIYSPSETYVEESYSDDGSAGESTDYGAGVESETSSELAYGEVITTGIEVYSEPCPCSSVVGYLDVGDVVDLYCYTSGDVVTNDEIEYSSDMWHSVDGGYISDAYVLVTAPDGGEPSC